MTNPVKSPLILVHGDKGGTGKSFTCRAIAASLFSRGYSLALVDADPRNAHLERVYSSAAVRLPLDTPGDWTRFYQYVETRSPSDAILVDLPAGAGAAIEAEDGRFSAMMAALRRTPLLVWVGDEEEDTIWLLQRALQTFAASHTLVVLNGRLVSASSNFTLWHGSKTRDAFVKAGGRETLLPLLPIHARAAFNRTRAPFDRPEAATLTMVERIDFDIWWELVEQALDPLLAMLEGR